MARNLLVRAGQTFTLDGDPTNEHADGFFELPIKKLQDMVDIGLISTISNLKALLSAAQASTEGALKRIAPQTSVEDGDSAAITDLGRYSSYVANAGSVPHNDFTVFWRVARRIDPV